MATAARPPTDSSFAAAASYLSTTVTADPISDGRRVALVYHLLVDDSGENYRFATAPPRRAFASYYLRVIAQILYLAHGRVAYSTEHDVTLDQAGFRALSKADKDFVRALDESECYDCVLAEAGWFAYPSIFSVVAPDGAEIPDMVLNDAGGFIYKVLNERNPRPAGRSSR